MRLLAPNFFGKFSGRGRGVSNSSFTLLWGYSAQQR